MSVKLELDDADKIIVVLYTKTKGDKNEHLVSFKVMFQRLRGSSSFICRLFYNEIRTTRLDTNWQKIFRTCSLRRLISPRALLV